MCAAPDKNPKKDEFAELKKVGFSFESEAYKYKLDDVIGNGGYGIVFEANATSKANSSDAKDVALKFEPMENSPSPYELEVQVLQSARDTNCKHIPKVLDHGTLLNRCFTFIAMERKGRDLHQLRKERKALKFSIGTALRIGIETLEALKELHEKCGYVSRDVKPGNFVTGSTTTDDDLRNVYLIDLGLCRKYRDSSGKPYSSRGETGWRGTARYGSLNAHSKQDLGRRDDMEGWFYGLMEATKGDLPWSKERERDLLFEKKKAARLNIAEFLAGCPDEYKELLQMIDKMEFADRPDYDKMRKLLEKALQEKESAGETTSNALMDWEMDEDDSGRPDDNIHADSIQQTPTAGQRRA